MQSQTKNEKFFIIHENHQLVLKENVKTVPDKSIFFSPVQNSLDILLKEMQ